MKVLIIEDERPASQKLIRLFEKIDPGIEVIDVLQSVEKAINWFHVNIHPELVFMDIQLEDGLCFEIFENCIIKTPVIFTTAYDEYALKAFKVNSIDYLLKPIVLVELKQAINKFNSLQIQKADFTKFESMLTQLQTKTKERFLVKIGEHYKSISILNINCFCILERCNFILIDTGKIYPIDYSLDKIEQLVDSKMFFRVNRNFIINISAIKDIVSYSSNRLKIILFNWNEKDDIIVSRERVAAYKEWMNR